MDMVTDMSSPNSTTLSLLSKSLWSSSPNSTTLSLLSKSLWSRLDAVALLQVGLSLKP